MFNLYKLYTKHKKKKIGLILGSGGAKGLAHIPVLQHLDGAGVPIHIIVGSSMGALIGAIYCAGNLESFTRDIMQLTKRKLLSLIDPVIPRSGLLEGKKIVSFLEKYISPNLTFEDLKIKLGIVATNYRDGRSVLFTSGNVAEAVRASISLPGIFVPVKYKGTFLIDGGVANPLPVNVAKRMGADITVAVNLHRRIDESKYREYMTAKKGRWELLVDSRKMETVPKNGDIDWFKSDETWFGKGNGDDARGGFPAITEVIMKTIDIMEYINTMLMLTYNRPEVLIEPDVEKFGTMDFLSADTIMEEGRRACARKGKMMAKKLHYRI